MKRFLLLSTMFLLLFTSRGYCQFVEAVEGGIPPTWTTFKTLNGTVVAPAPNVPNWVSSTTNVYRDTVGAVDYIDRLHVGADKVSEIWVVTEGITAHSEHRVLFRAS